MLFFECLGMDVLWNVVFRCRKQRSSVASPQQGGALKFGNLRRGAAQGMVHRGWFCSTTSWIHDENHVAVGGVESVDVGGKVELLFCKVGGNSLNFPDFRVCFLLETCARRHGVIRETIRNHRGNGYSPPYIFAHIPHLPS